MSNTFYTIFFYSADTILVLFHPLYVINSCKNESPFRELPEFHNLRDLRRHPAVVARCVLIILASCAMEYCFALLGGVGILTYSVAFLTCASDSENRQDSFLQCINVVYAEVHDAFSVIMRVAGLASYIWVLIGLLKAYEPATAVRVENMENMKMGLGMGMGMGMEMGTDTDTDNDMNMSIGMENDRGIVKPFSSRGRQPGRRAHPSTFNMTQYRQYHM